MGEHIMVQDKIYLLHETSACVCMGVNRVTPTLELSW